MKPILLVIRRELMERTGASSFRYLTLGLFLVAAAGVVAIDQASNIFGEDEFEVGVVGEAPPGFEEALDRFAESQDVAVTTQSVEGSEAAELRLRDDEIDAFLEDGRLVYETSDDPTLTSVVNQALYAARLPGLLDEASISPEDAEALLNPEPAEVAVLDPGDTDDEARGFIAFLAALSLYLTLAVYGNWILTGVVEEKMSRIVEVLLGLLRPYELLTGKTIGILLVAIGQLLAAVLGAVTGTLIVGADFLPDVAVDVVLASVPLYIAGVVLYSLLYAAVGATVTRQSDAQSASTPIVMLLLVPYMYAAIFVPQNPDGVASVIFSMVPFTSPLVMPARVATGSPSAVELIVCYGLLVPAVALTAWLGGRIYSIAIMSGRSFSLVGLFKAVFRPQQEADPSR